MFITFRKWTALYLLGLTLLLAGFAVVLRAGEAVPSSADAAPERGCPVLIIDPGHGGEDGGAVAADGTAESGINLAIALRMEEAAGLLGWETVMTRREDISIHDSDAQTLRQKKVSDLHNRADLCGGVEGGVLISIHQNSLPGAKSVRGAQVFYNGAEGSEALAQAIQEALNAGVNGGHPKTAKQIGDNVYLMKAVTCPAVLVECGFLSNAEETALLKSGEYQTRLAAVILSAAAEHLTGTA